MKTSIYNRYKFLFDSLLKIDIPQIRKLVINKVYDETFFEDTNPIKSPLAKEAIKIINNHLKFNSVFDLGCGMGLYLKEFYNLKKEVLGCDFSLDALRISPKEFTVFHADVTKPIVLNRKYDLLICFEVAEHILNKYSRQLVQNCTNNGKIIVFTAANKGQGGVGHINEQPQSWWIELFEEMHYLYDFETSSRIRSAMKKERVVSWLANNLMCFKSK